MDSGDMLGSRLVNDQYFGVPTLMETYATLMTRCHIFDNWCSNMAYSRSLEDSGVTLSKPHTP